MSTLRWHSAWGDISFDRANLEHSLRLRGDRVAKNETQAGQTPVVIGELTDAHQHDVLRYVHQTDLYLSTLLLIAEVNAAFWSAAIPAFLAGYNAAVSQRQ